ncbi:TY3B-TY3B protein [Mycena sanguinolenta]|uniref:TY3B-TY3B protein n=1 Tax=Mycena sanguinolenta TaxID=230812 RepID=A0A8H7D0B8_9AGAR|nr:TY3B-TY3B protein [Mycena sanguinolenta]
MTDTVKKTSKQSKKAASAADAMDSGTVHQNPDPSSPILQPSSDPAPRTAAESAMRSPSVAGSFQYSDASASGAFELHEYQGPQDTGLIDPTVRIERKELKLPTFKPNAKLAIGKPSVLERRNLALQMGAEAFDKPFLSEPANLSRRLFVSTFKHELSFLDRVLTSVDVAQLKDDGGQVYRLQKETVWTLVKQLDSLRKRAEYAFEMFHQDMPVMPTWGRREDPSAWYLANEFEILGVCYRAETEAYIAALDQYFDFSANELRPPDNEIKAYYDEYRRSLSRSVKRSSPVPNLSFDASAADSTFHLRLVSPTRPESVKDEEVSDRLPGSSGDESIAAWKTPANKSVPSSRKPRVDTVESEEDDSLRVATPKAAFGKSSTPPSKFNEAFGRIKFKSDSKSEPRSTKAHEGLHGTFKLSMNQGRDLPPHRPVSLHGFRLPNHSSKPSESEHLKQTRFLAKKSGQPDPGDDSSSSEDDKKGSKKPGNNDRGDRKPPRKSDRGKKGGNPDDPGDDDPDDGGYGGGDERGKPRKSSKKVKGRKDESSEDEENGRYFDLRLKEADVPKWDGNADNLLRWVQRCNLIAEDGPKAWKQLGKIVPRVLTGTAQDWYFSLPLDYRREIGENWETMREAIREFFLSAKWLDRTRTKALRATYRQPGNGREKPSEYFIRKRELLCSVYDFEDSAVISEVMNGAPRSWCTVLDTQKYQSIVEFHSALIFHEDTLMDLPMNKSEDHGRNDNGDRRPTSNASTRLAGSSTNPSPPPFPKDDSNVSKKATPESLGVRPCRHCGSGKHWDYECKHSFKGTKKARANLATAEEISAKEEYDAMYYGLSEDEQDFEQPLQSTGPLTFHVSADLESGGDTAPALKGISEPKNSQRARVEDVSDDEDLPNARLHPNSSFTILEEVQIPESTNIRDHLAESIPHDTPSQDHVPDSSATQDQAPDSESSDLSTENEEDAPETSPPSPAPAPKFALNRRSRRRLAREIQASSYRVVASEAPADKPLIELRKYMARPPGSSFLGAKAVETVATVGSLTADLIRLIADTGSDITLISRKALNSLSCTLKVKQGHDISLIQVTTSIPITGYVNCDLIFHTEDGPVKINVDAYVVDNMTTPFILGNDFMDQYSISILRKEGTTHLQFGDSGRRMQVENSTSPSLLDENGHTFQVKCSRARADRNYKSATHRRNQKFRQRRKRKERDGSVRSTERVVIQPKTSKLVSVETHFPKDCEQLIVERHLKSCGNVEDIYGSADTFITKEKPALHIANFSDSPVIISEGEIVGTTHNPRSWLDKASKMTDFRSTGTGRCNSVRIKCFVEGSPKRDW